MQLDFIRSDKPVENAFIESFNGRLRDECLSVREFAWIAEAQGIIETWRIEENQRRSHSSLGYLSPNEFSARRQAIDMAEEAVRSSKNHLRLEGELTVAAQLLSYASAELSSLLREDQCGLK